MGPWRLSVGNTIAPGNTVRQAYWWPTTNPYTGRVVGDWKGPQQALATPEQLLTSSNQVNTTGQGFVVGPDQIVYTVDITCEDTLGTGDFGSYELWVQGMLP